MLLELAIRDFAIIDDTRIAFEPGFNALTGETGAGKSILIDALGAVLGDRVGSEVVRTGAKFARIEATFDVAGLERQAGAQAVFDEVGVEPDEGALILSREIQAGGRSSARINGRAVTAGMLGRVGALLVDVHGQSDHLSLLRPAAQLDILDRYAGLLGQRAELAEEVGSLAKLRATIADLQDNARTREQRIDLLRFQSDEVAAAELRVGEEEELLAERSVLANAERLALDASSALVSLTGGDDVVDDAAVPALALLRASALTVGEIAAIDSAMAPVSERMHELLYLLEDVASDVRSYRDRIEANPARLAAVEDRLDLLKRLMRKYGGTVEEVLAVGEAASRELDSMTGTEADLDALQARETALVASVGAQATLLTRARDAAGERLAVAVEGAISDLNMGRARFSVSVSQSPTPRGVPHADANGTERLVAIDASGADRVEFLIAPNAGESLKPLARIASGGETARLMLALKSILADADATPTLVFDEVDVGVGGRSGQVVGEKLWRLSSGHQVVVITHLPQIAAYAESHVRISKAEDAGRAVSRVEAVAGDERVDELAAMLDGLPVSEPARENARAMLKRARDWKRTDVDGTSTTPALT